MKFKNVGIILLVTFIFNLITPYYVDAKIKTDNNIVVIENPINEHELTGAFLIKGYATAKSGIEKVQVKIDDSKWKNVEYGKERVDIQKKYSKNKNSKYSGFEYKVSGLKKGKHTVKIKAYPVGEKNPIYSEVEIKVDTKLTKIMGQGKVDKNKMKQVLLEKNNGNYSNAQLDKFVEYVIEEANAEGINYEIAFAQMMVETGYLNFGGDVKKEQNNFAGLGATGNGNPGESFSSMRIGVRAVIQHLKAYASDKDLNNKCVDNRFKYVKRKSAEYVEYLGIKENPWGYGWAAGIDYGKKIKKIINVIEETKIKTSKVISLEVDGKFEKGKTIKIKANATPQNETKYKFMAKINGKWKTIQNTSEKKEVSYKIKDNGEHIFRVLVKNKNSSNRYDDFKTSKKYFEEINSKVNEFKVDGTMKVGEIINLEATASPKDNTYYKFMVKENGKWKTIQGTSKKSSAEYKLTKKGDYIFRVLVKNKYSNKKYDDFKSSKLKKVKPKEKVILIDPGHGSGNLKYDNGDTGSSATHSGKKYIESKLNIEIAKKLKKQLEKKGFKVLMTREEMNDDLEFKKRASYGNKNDVDLYISVHQNSFFNSSANGVEVLYDDSKMDEEYRNEVIENGMKDPNSTHLEKVKKSKEIANLVTDNLSSETKLYNRGAKQQKLHVLRNSKSPGILIECGFLSNSTEAKKLADDKFQDKIANAISESIYDFYK